MGRQRGRIRSGAVACAVAMTAAACGTSGPAANEPIAAATIIHGTVSQPSLRSLNRRFPTDAAFSTGGVGVMFTDSGAIERSRDGGRTWRVIARHPGLSNLVLLSPRIALATAASRCRGNVCDEQLMHSTNGGVRWTPVATIARTSYTDLGGLQFPSAVGTFSTASGTLRTLDGGRSWTRLKLPCGNGYSGGVSFTSAEYGYALCGGESGGQEETKTLFRTADGGRHWRLIARAYFRRERDGEYRDGGSLPLSGYVGGILARPGGRVIISFPLAGLYVSDDGGRHWRLSYGIGDGSELVSMSWPTTGRIELLTSDGELHATRADGRDWQPVYPGGVGSPEEGPIAFLTASEGVATGTRNPGVGRNQIDITHDGGRRWTPESRIAGAFGPDDIIATDRHDVWVTSAPLPLTDQLQESVWHSHDGGRHWQRVRIPPRLGPLSISFASPTVGFLLTEVGEVYRSTDAGRHWRRMRGPGRNVEDAFFVSPRIGFVTYSGGGMSETTDGGGHFVTLNLPRDIASLGDAASLEDGRHWWISAHRCVKRQAGGLDTCTGALLRTSDGGRHWQLILLPQFIGADSLSFANSRDGYADVSSLGIFRTTDGGVHWRLVPTPQL